MGYNALSNAESKNLARNHQGETKPQAKFRHLQSNRDIERTPERKATIDEIVWLRIGTYEIVPIFRPIIWQTKIERI